MLCPRPFIRREDGSNCFDGGQFSLGENDALAKCSPEGSGFQPLPILETPGTLPVLLGTRTLLPDPQGYPGVSRLSSLTQAGLPWQVQTRLQADDWTTISLLPPLPTSLETLYHPRWFSRASTDSIPQACVMDNGYCKLQSILAHLPTVTWASFAHTPRLELPERDTCPSSFL